MGTTFHSPIGRLLALSVGLAVLFAAAVVLAEKVRCPVCRQVFEEEHDICPNDGTDLRLSGLHYDEETEDQENAEGKPAKAEDEDEDSRYHRHDRGGDRQRHSEEEETDYSDRHKRIGEGKRGTDLQAEKRRKARRKRRKEFKESDERLRDAFAQKRRKMWEDYGERAHDERMADMEQKRREREALWGRGAPLISAGVRVSWMGEGKDSGPVTGAEVDVNLIRTKLRLGLSSHVAVRSLSSRGDIFFQQSASVGVQWPWRFSPYIAARVGVGVLLSNRFGQDITYLSRSIGFDAGFDCRLTPWLVVTPSMGYVRYMIEEAYWDSFTAKLSIGF